MALWGGQLRREGRVTVVSDVVQRHQAVKVKVLSFNGQRISLSIKVALHSISPLCHYVYDVCLLRKFVFVIY